MRNLSKVKIWNLIFLLGVIACNKDNNIQPYMERAVSLDNQGEYKAAIAILDKAIEKYPYYLGAYINRGAYKSALGKYEAAIEDYNKVLERDSNNLLALYNKANNLKRIQKWQEAIFLYEKAINMIQKRPIQFYATPAKKYSDNTYEVPLQNIKYELALAYDEIDSLEKALEAFYFCAQRGYNEAEALNAIGGIYYRIQDAKEACKYFRASANLKSEYGIANFYKYCGQ